MPAPDAIDAQLMGPGGPFETVWDDVLGERMEVFKERPPSLRTYVERSLGFGDAEYMIFGERRFTYAAHARAVASVARALAPLADAFGVALVEEGIALRRLGLENPILVFGGTWTKQIPLFLEHRLTLTVPSLARLRDASTRYRRSVRRERSCSGTPGALSSQSTTTLSITRREETAIVPGASV